MESVLFDTYIISNFDAYLNTTDIIHMRQTCKSIKSSLDYKNKDIRYNYFLDKFYFLYQNAQKQQNPILLDNTIFYYCIQNQYFSCLFFRDNPEIFAELMKRLEIRSLKKTKHNQLLVDYLSDSLQQIYCNFSF